MENKMKQKQCPKCGRLLDLSNFGKHHNSKDGYMTLCNDCRKGSGGAKLSKVYTNPELSLFTARQLYEELQARGYHGTLEITKKINI